MINLGILKYTLQKYLKSYSLWIIILISFLLIFILAGVIGLNSFDPNTANANQKYIETASNVVILTNSFISGILAIFAGIFGAKTYRDDVENGSFLIILAKPTSKRKIIFSQYLAFLILNICFTFLIALFFIITIAIFDSGYQIENLSIGNISVYSLTSQLGKIFLLTWTFLIILSFFFSGVALIMGTFLSLKGVIGFTIALALFFQISSLISVFTKNKEFEYLSAHNTNYLKTVLPDQEWNNVDEPISFYNVGVTNKKRDDFKFTWIFDFNYHRNSMASIITNSFFPLEAEIFFQESITNNKLNFSRFSYKPNDNFLKTSKLDNQFFFDKMIVDSWDATTTQRFQLAEKFQSFLEAEITTINIKMPKKLENLLTNFNIDSKGQLTYNTLKTIANLDFKNFDNNKQGVFFIMLLELSKLYQENPNSFVNLDKEAILLSKRGIDFLKACRTLFWPLHWLNDWTVNDFKEKANIDVDLEISPNNFADQVPMLMISSQISDDQRYQIISSAINQGYMINKIETQEYGNKYYIIAAYVAISVILILSSFWILMRKNI